MLIKSSEISASLLLIGPPLFIVCVELLACGAEWKEHELLM